MKNIFLLVSIFSLFLVDCNREYYQTSAYDNFAPKHQTVAVLPSQTITSGRIPKDWTEDQVKKIEENESFAFQVAVFDEVVERSGAKDKDISINVQHYSETNALLEKAGIGIRESWSYAPTELAKILGVDAVVRTAVKKDMYLTDLESFGVSMAQTAIGALTGNYFGLLPSKTSDVFLSASILDAETSTPVWAMDKATQTDWNDSHQQIVRKLARVMARRFPYRV